MRFLVVIYPGCSDRIDRGHRGRVGRWSCSGLMCSDYLVTFDAVDLVRWINVVLALESTSFHCVP